MTGENEISNVNVFEEIEATAPKTIEASSSISPYYEPSQYAPYNPKKLYRKKGNYDIYDEMRLDDQIKSIMQTKKWIMLSSGYDISYPPDVKDSKAEEIRDFIFKCLDRDAELPFKSSLEEILTAMEYGFSITEIVWKIEDSKVKLKYLKTRAPHGFNLHTDDKGNLTYVEQHTNKGPIKLDPKDFIVFPYQKEFDIWYGNSDLDACYRAWWAKDFIIKAWNVYLDRFGMPVVKGTYDDTIGKEEQEKLQTVLNNIQTKTSMVLPKDIEVELLEATRGGNAGYDLAIDKYNLMIARSLLMPDLMGFSGHQTSGGSYSLGQSQYQLFLMILEKTREQLEICINRQIIKPLVEYNFGKLGFYPEFKFKQMSNTQKIEALKVWTEFVSKSGYKPSEEEINWGRNILGAPEGEVEERATPVNPLMPNQPKKEDDEDEEDEPEEKKMALNSRQPVMAEHKQNFTLVEKRISKVEQDYVSNCAEKIRLIQESLIETVKKEKFLENKRLDKVNELKLKNTNELRVELKSGMKEMYDLGLKDAKREFKPKQTKYIDLTDDEMIDEIIYEAPVFVTSTITDDILKQAKIVLRNGITQGLSVIEVIGQLNKIFEPYDPAFDGSRLETIIRTNYMKVYNNTKQAYFKPAQDAGEIVAYQYSAIIDSRTSDFCRDHDKKIYLANSSFMQNSEPPNHFNCRSIVIPITREEFENKEIFGATEEENQEFFPEGKFKESPTYEDVYEKQPGGFWTKK